jgi:hypothetical protein
MHFYWSPLIVAGLYPFCRAWFANRHTTLKHAICWAGIAWIAWGAALTLGTPSQSGLDPWRFVALSLTGAAGVAVLGARRPHAGAWNFVVLGLLAVLLLPLGENLALGTKTLGLPRMVFLAGTLAVGIINYVPTVALIPAVLLGAICTGECLALFVTDVEFEPSLLDAMHVSLLLMPWLAWAFWRPARAEAMPINRLWRGLRDRYGLFWGQRVREQYNRGAAHAGLPGFLYWHGWQLRKEESPPTDAQTQAIEALFKAVLKRFGDNVQES